LKKTKYFNVYVKLNTLRIESEFGLGETRCDDLIRAGWKLIGKFEENRIQFMVDGEAKLFNE
jgi:hypothetical protein